jgi:hypothetical protein
MGKIRKMVGIGVMICFLLALYVSYRALGGLSGLNARFWSNAALGLFAIILMVVRFGKKPTDQRESSVWGKKKSLPAILIGALAGLVVFVFFNSNYFHGN